MRQRIDPEIIKAARKAKGLSQYKFGAMIWGNERVGEKMVQAIESGRAPIPVAKLIPIADALGLDVRDLLPK
jgi:transcriptional regulator with XRE-family HTH domain